MKTNSQIQNNVSAAFEFFGKKNEEKKQESKKEGKK